jgi:hypothetical protein
MYRVWNDSQGKPHHIDVTGLPKNPTEPDVRPVMEAVSKALGQSWIAGKSGGYWLIGTNNDGDWQPVYGHRPGEQARSFLKALSLATGLQVTFVPNSKPNN